MGYLFDRRGQVRKEFVKERRRKDLVEGLKHRFIFMGCLNLMFSPFIVFYLLIYSFFRYFEVCHTLAWSQQFKLCGDVGLINIGISQEPFIHWWKTVHALRPMEVPGV